MDKNNLAIALLILVALLLANLPFLSDRLFASIRLPTRRFARKPLWLRLIELTLLYGLTGVLAYQLEAHSGNVQVQHWEFYAITYCCFLVMAYPGFVWCYLRRQPHSP